MNQLSQLNSTGGAPWLVGIPTREADFVASEPQYQRFARQVDLSAIPVFAAAPRDGVTDPCLGWADAQRAPHAPSSRCPGSGRAIFFEGHYLKGVGRTHFAWNWNVRNSTMHGTGHLAASGAVRELLISDYLEAAGSGSTIVPCVAILVRDMESEFARPWCRYADEENIALAPVDRTVQAISVKPGGFLRWSNIIHELLQTDVGTGALIEPLELLYRGLGGGGADDGVTPRAICELITAAIERGLANFERLYHHGVYWHSFNNNSTLDGRFLDLELASVLGEGHPCGLRYSETKQASPDRIAGLGVVPGEELAFFVRQTRQSIQEVIRVLTAAAGAEGRGSTSRDYLATLADGMRDVCAAEPMVRTSEDALARRLGAMWGRHGGDRAVIDDCAQRICAEYLDDAPAAHLDDGGQACPHYDLANPEPGVRARVLYPEASSGPPRDARAIAARDTFNDALRQLDSTRSSAQLLELLDGARQRVRLAAAALNPSAAR
ncbi:MAG: hypothetical protein K0V04_29025 [Deltaproteobacteria bacterium]|nr:hypothetical protein [Deltaproteobacteria bacterium]